MLGSSSSLVALMVSSHSVAPLNCIEVIGKKYNIFILFDVINNIIYADVDMQPVMKIIIIAHCLTNHRRGVSIYYPENYM